MNQAIAEWPIWLIAINEFLKTIISWPLAAFLIIWLLRHHILTILPRIRKLGPSGVELDPGHQASVEKRLNKDANDIKEFPGAPRTGAVQEMEHEIRKQIESLNPEIKNNIKDLLILNLAHKLLEVHFVYTYHLIFGSQIMALRRLKVSKTSSYKEAFQFFEEVRAMYPEAYKNTSFDEWASFLIHRRLVVREGDIFKLSDIGSDFLNYMDMMRLPENKPL